MKGFMVFLFMFFSFLTALSQEWTRTEFQADELKGNDSYVSYMYSKPAIGSFVCWSNSPNRFRIINDNGIFNYDLRQTALHKVVKEQKVKVGLYNDKDELIEQLTIWMYSELDKPSYLETKDIKGYLSPKEKQEGKKIKKIMKHLISGIGYVRILADTFGERPDFDLKIPSTLKME